MIAYAMNGDDLPWLNGFPVRLVVPGYYGAYRVKPLNTITVLDAPLDTRVAVAAPETIAMRISLSKRAGRVCAAATLLFSLGLAPSFAHMAAPLARPALGPGHFPVLAARGFNRFGFSRFGWNGRNGAACNWNQPGVTGCLGDPISAPTAPSEPIIIGGGGPPVVISINGGPGTGALDPGFRTIG